MSWPRYQAVGLFFLIPLFASNLLYGALARPLSVGFGGGVPQLIALRGQVQVASHWQLGAGYGLLPTAGFIADSFRLPTQNLTLSDGSTYQLTSVGAASLSTLSPFVRFFPSKTRNVYLEAAVVLLRVNIAINSNLLADGTQVASGVLNGNVSFTQYMPTISLGHMFAGELFFLDFSLGVSFLANVTSSIGLTGAIPDLLGGQAENQAETQKASQTIQTAVDQASATYKSQVFLIPSLMLTFGLLI